MTDKLCKNKCPNSKLTCEKPQGHAGQHECKLSMSVVTWGEREEPPVERR